MQYRVEEALCIMSGYIACLTELMDDACKANRKNIC